MNFLEEIHLFNCADLKRTIKPECCFLKRLA
jgi:hypothetical protein